MSFKVKKNEYIKKYNKISPFSSCFIKFAGILKQILTFVNMNFTLLTFVIIEF